MCKKTNTNTLIAISYKNLLSIIGMSEYMMMMMRERGSKTGSRRRRNEEGRLNTEVIERGRETGAFLKAK